MPNHMRARRAVMGALLNLPDWLDFEIHSFRVTRERLRGVRAAILGSNQGRQSGDEPRRGIFVFHNNSYRHGAVYNSTLNSMTVGFDRISLPTQKALVVHEAVHAMADIMGCNWMRIQTSEASAHIAQCIVLMDHYGRDASPPTSTDTNQRALFAQAWAVARILHDRRRPSWGEYQNVWNAVAAVQDYSSYGLEEELDYRGVPGVSRDLDEAPQP